MHDKVLIYNIQLVPRDYVFHDFHSFFGKGKPILKVMMCLSYAIVFIALVVSTIKFWYLFPLTGIIILYPFILKYVAEDRFKSYKSRRLREDLIYTLDQSGINIQGETFESYYKWEEFKEITEGNQAFYFWEVDSFALLLPKRYVSDNELNSIRTLLTKNK